MARYTEEELEDMMDPTALPPFGDMAKKYIEANPILTDEQWKLVDEMIKNPPPPEAYEDDEPKEPTSEDLRSRTASAAKELFRRNLGE